MSDFFKSIERIKTWAAVNAPDALANLQLPASSSRLALLRELLPAGVPEELFEWFGLHDGDGNMSWNSMLPDGMQFLNADWLIEMYSYGVASPDVSEESLDANIATIRGPVRPYWFGPLRVPFAHRNGEVLWVIDLDPGPGGDVGQVIYDDAECVHLEVLASSIGELLAQYASELEQGDFFVSEEGCICSRQGRIWPNYALLN